MDFMVGTQFDMSTAVIENFTVHPLYNSKDNIPMADGTTDKHMYAPLTPLSPPS